MKKGFRIPLPLPIWYMEDESLLNPAIGNLKSSAPISPLTKRAQYHKRLLEQFTNSWKKEYLMSLRETSVFLHRPSKEIIQVGDIVLLRNESKPRAFWKLAKVTELVRGRDGAVRSAKIQCLTSSREKTTELRRPIQHLVPLELRAGPELPDM